jgi:hypothetical protein
MRGPFCNGISSRPRFFHLLTGPNLRFTATLVPHCGQLDTLPWFQATLITWNSRETEVAPLRHLRHVYCRTLACLRGNEPVWIIEKILSDTSQLSHFFAYPALLTRKRKTYRQRLRPFTLQQPHHKPKLRPPRPRSYNLFLRLGTCLSP